MKVFVDTTPFIALAAIGQAQLLPALFQRVHVVRSVIDECAAGGRFVVPDLAQVDWVIPVEDDDESRSQMLLDLDRGERDTIASALSHRADLVVVDEKLGRRLAAFLGLRVTGTLGVLARARVEGLVPSFRAAAMAMRAQGIFFSLDLIEQISRRVGEADQAQGG